MILTCHMVLGAAIAEKTGNPFLGLTFAFLSHYVLDLIPHKEYLKEIKPKRSHTFSNFLKIGTDFIFGTLVLLFFSQNKILALYGGFFAVLPDSINLAYFFPGIVNDKFLKIESVFHGKIIHFWEKKKIFLFWKIASQALVFSISLYFLIQ
jgi:hypothetical protein